MSDTEGHTPAWSWDRVVIAAVASLVCLGLALRSIAGREWKVEPADVALLGFALAAWLIPYARKLSAGPEGLVFEARQEAEKARAERMEAETAAQVARVYYSVSATLSGRLETGYEDHRSYALLLLALTERAEPVAFAEYIELLPYHSPALTTAKMMDPEGGTFDIARQIAAEGLIELTGDTPEDATVAVAPEFVEPIKQAFAYLAERPWEWESEPE